MLPCLPACLPGSEVRRDQELLVGELVPAEHLDWDAQAEKEVATGENQDAAAWLQIGKVQATVGQTS